MKIRKKTIIFLALLSIIFIAGCSSSSNSDLDLLSVSNSGLIMPMQDVSYDWGDINIKGGDVERSFSFRNDGEKDLILKGAMTSCMCTEATFKLPNDELSPVFGMHENKSWTYPIKPGEEFSINVVFDPMAHGPEATGPISRSIYIETSSNPNGNYAKVDSESNKMILELKLDGNVLAEDIYERKQEM